MSSKSKTSVEMKARLKALKKLGLLPNIDSRKELTDSQKKRVRAEWKKYHTIGNLPEAYVKKNIGKLTPSDKTKLKETGYTIIGDHLYIPKDGYDSASVRTTWFRNEKGKQEKRIEVVRRAGNGRKEEIEFIGKPHEKMNWRDRLLREYQNGKFKDGEYFGVRVFDNGLMTREIVTNINTLFKYIDNIQWKDKDINRLLDNLHIVKLSVKDHRDLSLGEKTRKQADHQKYIRKKNSKKTKTKTLLGKVKRK